MLPSKWTSKCLLFCSLCACMLSASVVSDSLWPYGLELTRLLCPWDSPRKNTGVRFHALLHSIFPTQGLNPYLSCLLHWQAGFFFFFFLPLVSPGNPFYSFSSVNSVAQSCLDSLPPPWIAVCQASLSITNSWSLLKLMSFGDAIQPFHPLSSPFPAFNLSQH